MSAPQELSIAEIQKFMLANGCKVTNHALVKHFKRFLTKPDSQNEARQQFKTYVNILATIKNENNQKYLILRKKYLHECPSAEAVERAVAAAAAETSAPSSPGGVSIASDNGLNSPYRQPPPYKPPPEVASPTKPLPAAPPSAAATGIVVHKENVENYRDCVNEFAAAMRRLDPARLERQSSADEEAAGSATEEKEPPPVKDRDKDDSRKNSVEEQNKENIPRFSFSSGNSATSITSTDNGEKAQNSEGDLADNPISVKEATRKFNRMASEEEAKIISPPNKKKTDKVKCHKYAADKKFKVLQTQQKTAYSFQSQDLKNVEEQVEEMFSQKNDFKERPGKFQESVVGNLSRKHERSCISLLNRLC